MCQSVLEKNMYYMLSISVMPCPTDFPSISFLRTTANVSSQAKTIIYSFLCPPGLLQNVCGQELPTSLSFCYFAPMIDLGSPAFLLCELGKVYIEGISGLPCGMNYTEK